MIKLKQVKIEKYKSIQKSQTVEIDPAITTIVGMNEAGKTSFLTALAKMHYFNDDVDFKFDTTQDYPRSELIDFESSDEDCNIVSCSYEISDSLLKEIEDEMGKDVFTIKNFTYSRAYKSKKFTYLGLVANQKKFLEFKVASYSLSEETKKTIIKSNSLNDIAAIVASPEDEDIVAFKADIKKFVVGAHSWDNLVQGYIAKSILDVKLPKFWYFDDYYPLSGKININRLVSLPPTDEKDKTSKALFELARIKPEEILSANDAQYEKYIALLEASSNKITNEIFKYWSTNKNLDIEFKIQSITNLQGQPEKGIRIFFLN